eukprot:g44651.t1
MDALEKDEERLDRLALLSLEFDLIGIYKILNDFVKVNGEECCLLWGHMPTIQLLRKYDLLQFSDVTKAVSEGNLLLLNDALAKHEAFFIRCGIFLILEKLKIITYRNLFKK